MLCRFNSKTTWYKLEIQERHIHYFVSYYINMIFRIRLECLSYKLFMNDHILNCFRRKLTCNTWLYIFCLWSNTSLHVIFIPWLSELNQTRSVRLFNLLTRKPVVYKVSNMKSYNITFRSMVLARLSGGTGVDLETLLTGRGRGLSYGAIFSIIDGINCKPYFHFI